MKKNREEKEKRYVFPVRRWGVVVVMFLLVVIYAVTIIYKLVADGPLSVFEHMTNLTWILELVVFILIFLTQFTLAVTEYSLPLSTRAAVRKSVYTPQNKLIPQEKKSKRLALTSFLIFPSSMHLSPLIISHPWYAHARALSDTVLLFTFWPILNASLVVAFVVLVIIRGNPAMLLNYTRECSRGDVAAGVVFVANWFFHYFPPFVFFFVLSAIRPDMEVAFRTAWHMFSRLRFAFFIAWNTILGVLIPFVLYIIVVDYKTVYNTHISFGVAFSAGLVATIVGNISFFWLVLETFENSKQENCAPVWQQSEPSNRSNQQKTDRRQKSSQESLFLKYQNANHLD